MKKTIIIEVLLLFVFCVALACAIKILIFSTNMLYMIDYANNVLQYENDNLRIEYIASLNEQYNTALSYGIPAIFAAVADLAAMVIIAIKDFPVFKPLVDKFKAHKEQRDAAKAKQAEIAKQERINELQAELDELKKDE